MSFKNNGIANFLLGSISGYAVANSLDVSMGATASLVLLIFIVIAGSYTFPGE